mgnify:FL=1|jgi:hypothetical protein
MRNMKTKFPLEHVVKVDTKEVWIKCNSSTTAMGIPALVNKYYPGYTGHIASEEYLKELKNQLAN